MDVPESVRIAGVEYRIVDVEHLTHDNHLAYGQIDYSASEIRLSSTAGMSHDMKCLTLLHEITHGILDNAQIELEDCEKVVEAFSRGMYQVLQDNKDRLFGKENT